MHLLPLVLVTAGTAGANRVGRTRREVAALKPFVESAYLYIGMGYAGEVMSPDAAMPGAALLPEGLYEELPRPGGRPTLPPAHADLVRLRTASSVPARPATGPRPDAGQRSIGGAKGTTHARQGRHLRHRLFGGGPSAHEPFDPDVVGREMRVIRDDLHCTAVRITGAIRTDWRSPPPTPPMPAWRSGSRHSPAT